MVFITIWYEISTFPSPARSGPSVRIQKAPKEKPSDPVFIWVWPQKKSPRRGLQIQISFVFGVRKHPKRGRPGAASSAVGSQKDGIQRAPAGAPADPEAGRLGRARKEAALNRRSARSQDFIAVVHSESAHRETTKTQILALIVLSREVHGSARKVRSPIKEAF